MRTSSTLLLAVAFALWTAAAQAQAFTSDKKLLLSDGVLRGSPRLMGIAGAFVGIAEGAEGITRNPAAAISKDPHFERDFNVDFGAALHFLPPWSVTSQDWDNDGRLDQVEPLGSGLFDFFGTQVIYLAASAQYKDVGLGLGVDLQNFIGRTPLGGFNLGLVHFFSSLAASVWKDQILVGLGIESTQALFLYFEDRQLRDRLGYHGWGFQFGALWRPKDENYRVGFAFRPQTVGNPDVQKTTIGNFTPFSQIIAPARVSVGASWALGEGGRNYNITDAGGWAPAGMNPDGTERFSAAMTKWLVTGQIDMFWAVQNATHVTAFLEQGTGLPAESAGDQVAFEPRVAVEKEVFEDAVRVRAGAYLEPPLVRTGHLRPHMTFGAEVYLFKLGGQRISFGLSFDIAQRYQNLSVAFLVWK